MYKESEITEIPKKSIDEFINTLPSSQNMPLEQGVKFQGMHKQLGPAEELPELVQNIIGDIKDAETIAEKAAIAHSFSQSFIQSEVQNAEQERDISFEGLASDPKGDCDDYQTFMAGLLLHGDVNPRDIFMLAGEISYETSDKSHIEGHAFIVVKDGDDYLLLDNNLHGTPLIDPANPVIQVPLANEEGGVFDIDGVPLETATTINYIAEANDARGSNYDNAQAVEMLLKSNMSEQAAPVVSTDPALQGPSQGT